MKLSRLYDKVVRFGRDRDPRKDSSVKSFEDTAVLYGRPAAEIKKILVGIDIELGELLLADRIRQKTGLDLVLAHHPEGKAAAGLYRVMQLQVDLLIKLGLGRSVAQEFLDERKREIERRLLPQNHMRAPDAARLLDLPFMCVHTPADNHVAFFLQALLEKKKPKRVGDIIAILLELPEYKIAAGLLSGPRVVAGSPARPAGRIFVDMTGGTEGPKEVFDKIYKAGVRTLVCMHLSEEHFKKVKDADLNVVIAGHISSDTLGLNLLLDRIEKEEKFQIFECSGFRRFRRG
jgi:putative NIF3 family GTP cyclohydrolase 1 type 2